MGSFSTNDFAILCKQSLKLSIFLGGRVGIYSFDLQSSYSWTVPSKLLFSSESVSAGGSILLLQSDDFLLATKGNNSSHHFP